MAYEVLARKWRPKHFADVIGQEHVTRTLINAIESGRVAHAYLFVGPRGIGKTTLSRIFAKALNCSSTPDATPNPCDTCANCQEIMAGTSLDVVEIDAASNNGVDSIRNIRETARFAPANSRYKIFIVDEVHMLSIGAFNALLKTLEEPPPHVKFIFATTEFDKLPATIVSRCQRFDLRRIPTALIVSTLAKICASEGVTASEDALLAIARGAEGGMRDALSALDQIISFKGTDVTEADILSVFGLVSRAQIEKMATAILKGDMAGGLKLVDELDSNGKDLTRLVLELLGHFRNLIVFQQLGKESANILDVTPEQLKTLAAQAPLADSGRVLRVAEHLVGLESTIRHSLSRRTVFETALLRCCRATSTVTLDQVIRQISSIGPVTAADLPAPATPAAAAPASAAAPAPATPPAQPPTHPAQPAATPVPPASPPPAPTTPPPATGMNRPSLKSALNGTTAAPRATMRPAAPAPAPAPMPAPAPRPAPAPTPKAPASATAADDDNPIRAANEPAIKEALSIFRGTITEIRPPTAKQVPETTSDDPDALTDMADFMPDQEFESQDPV